MTFTNIGTAVYMCYICSKHNMMKNNQELDIGICFQVLQGLRRPKTVSLETERSVSS